MFYKGVWRTESFKNDHKIPNLSQTNKTIMLVDLAKHIVFTVCLPYAVVPGEVGKPTFFTTVVSVVMFMWCLRIFTDCVPKWVPEGVSI